jgi:hypothetical protein
VLQRGLAQLTAYSDKYKKRLNTKNLVYIRQIVAVLRGLLRFLSEPSSDQSNPPPSSSAGNGGSGGGGGKGKEGGATTTSMHEVTDFLYAAKIDNINLFMLERYFEKSEISVGPPF